MEPYLSKRAPKSGQTSKRCSNGLRRRFLAWKAKGIRDKLRVSSMFQSINHLTNQFGTHGAVGEEETITDNEIPQHSDRREHQPDQARKQRRLRLLKRNLGFLSSLSLLFPFPSKDIMYSQSSIPPFVYLIPAFFHVCISPNSQHSSMAFSSAWTAFLARWESQWRIIHLFLHCPCTANFSRFKRVSTEYEVRGVTGRVV